MDLFHVRLLFSPRSDGGVSALISYSPTRTLCPLPYRSPATPMQYRLACRRRAPQTVIVFRKPYRATTHMCSLDRARYSRAVRVGLSIVNWRQHRLTTSISSRFGIFRRPPSSSFWRGLSGRRDRIDGRNHLLPCRNYSFAHCRDSTLAQNRGEQNMARHCLINPSLYGRFTDLSFHKDRNSIFLSVYLQSYFMISLIS